MPNFLEMYVAHESLLEEVMTMRAREMSDRWCAYCGEPLAFNAAGVLAWRVGTRFVCNEFCAEGVSNDCVNLPSADRADAPELRGR
jgi:hypothetical protein